MSGPGTLLTAAAALGSALMAGAYLAFSSFVMHGLAQLPPAQGIAAMQSINRSAVRPPFMTMLFGPAVVCVGIIVWAIREWERPDAPWSLAGALVYLSGSIVVTALRNVPLNEALAIRDPNAADANDMWRCYLRRWTVWNHVRAIASVAATVVLIIALVIT